MINVIPTDLLTSIRGIGEITLEKIKLLKDIGCTLNLEIPLGLYQDSILLKKV